MPTYMLILGGTDLDKRQESPTYAPEVFQRYLTWMRGMRDAGHYLGGHPLYNQTGRRLTVRGGEIIDGPFIESKDAVGGIILISAESLDEAAEMARGCPGLLDQNGYVEVRVVKEGQPALD